MRPDGKELDREFNARCTGAKRVASALVVYGLALVNAVGFTAAFWNLERCHTVVGNLPQHLVVTAEFCGITVLLAMIFYDSIKMLSLGPKDTALKPMILRSVAKYLIIAKSFSLLSTAMLAKELLVAKVFVIMGLDRKPMPIPSVTVQGASMTIQGDGLYEINVMVNDRLSFAKKDSAFEIHFDKDQHVWQLCHESTVIYQAEEHACCGVGQLPVAGTWSCPSSQEDNLNVCDVKVSHRTWPGIVARHIHHFLAALMFFFVILVSPAILMVKFKSVSFMTSVTMDAWSPGDWVAVLLLVNNLSNIEMMKQSHLGETPADHMRAAVKAMSLQPTTKEDDHRADVRTIFGNKVDLMKPLSNAAYHAEMFVSKFNDEVIDRFGDKFGGTDHFLKIKQLFVCLACVLAFKPEDVDKLLEPARLMLVRFAV